MGTRLLLATVAVVVVTGPMPIPARAQQASVAGSWAVKSEAAEGQNPDGSNWRLNALTGVLAIDQKDGELTGTWTGPKKEPWPFTGRKDGETFELTTTARDLPATINGEPATVPARWIFRGVLSGDTLKGTMALGREGTEPQQVAPFTAERMKK